MPQTASSPLTTGSRKAARPGSPAQLQIRLAPNKDAHNAIVKEIATPRPSPGTKHSKTDREDLSEHRETTRQGISLNPKIRLF